MLKRLFIVAVGAGLLSGCGEASISMEKSKLVPSAVQEASLIGNRDNAVLTLTTRREKHVFSGVITEDTATRLRLRAKLDNSDRVVNQEFTFIPHHLAGVWICDGCSRWTENLPVMLVNNRAK